MRWLRRAHDAGGTRGVAKSYSVGRALRRREGWRPAYPEVTGYLVPTFFNYAEQTGASEYRRRAEQMAEWEIEIQLDGGAVRAGVVGDPPRPTIFNTGQVLFGWVRCYEETGEERPLAAARRAGDFLVDAQDADGAWRSHRSPYARDGINLYDARAAWGLLEVARVTGEERYRAAARRNLDFVLTCQLGNGWFTDCCIDDETRPLLHTIAYTIEALLEAAASEGDERYLEAARRAADALLPHQREDGSLPGRFSASWQPAVRWSCLTGNAQAALVWLRLHQETDRSDYVDAAQQALRFLMRTQDLEARDLGVRGGIRGAVPIWSAYEPYEYLSWAAKFFVDALLLETSIASAAAR